MTASLLKKNPPVAELPAGWPALTLAQAHAALTAPGSPLEVTHETIGGRQFRVWKNGPKSFVELFVHSRIHADKTFLVLERERASYEDFARAALALAHELTAEGVGKGDRVALAMRNLPEWPVAFFGALIAGAVITPLNAWWTGPELQYGLTDAGCKVAILDRERLARLAEHLHDCPQLERVYVTRENEDIAHPKVRRLEDVIGRVDCWRELPDRPMPQVAIAPEDDATILYTSGTTGKPKGALGTHRNGVCSVLAAQFNAARNFVRRGQPVPAPDPSAPQRGVLLSIPLFHVTGCQAVM
jgi:long-chain acyl-CoA synthetase